MKLQTFYSLKTLVKEGRRRAEKKDVITFDLFDTLLVRRIHDPDLVKLPVARFIETLAQSHGVEIGWQQVQAVRDRVEQEQRDDTGTRFDDHEACYPVFMEKTLREIFFEKYWDGLLQEVTGYELKMENSMLVPRKELVQWLDELKKKGKRLFIISDMYLPASHLKVLVAYAGLDGLVDDVISSADTFLAKASGRGFEFVQKKYSLEKEKWLHIGDNGFSDGLRAEEFGIEALIIKDPGESMRKSIVKRYVNYSDGRPFWRGRALQQLMAPLEGENSPRPDLYIEGYNFIGPLVGSFIQELIRKCRENNITKVFFLSREGYTFKKYWEGAVPFICPDNSQPEIEYLYVSRMALAGACCAHQGLTKTNVDIAFLPAGNRDFHDVCRIFSLDVEPFQTILQEHGLETETCLSHVHDGYDPENRKKFNTMLGNVTFQEEVKRQTRPSGRALEMYLEDIGYFEHDNVAIVDIGWLGTIPRFFNEAIAHRKDRPCCFSYLFGATRGIPYPQDDKNRLEGVMYDRDRFDLAASTLFYARDLFEEACRAPHPTLNGYRLKEDGGYELEFRKTDDAIGRAELEQDQYFAPLQQGIIDSATRFGAASALLGYDLQDFKPWLNYLFVSKLAFPKSREIINIRHRNHLDDFHGSKKPRKDFGQGIRSLWEYSYLQLRLNPLLRLQLFFRHLRERINE